MKPLNTPAADAPDICGNGVASRSLPKQHANRRAQAMTGAALAVLSTCFNFVLCFLNTQHLLAVRTSVVVGAEVLFLACGILIIRNVISEALLQVSSLVVLAIVALVLLNHQVNAKILFDLAIVPVFFLLGRVSDRRIANGVVIGLMVLTTVVGLAEMISPDTYSRFFNIWEFYIAKGSIDTSAVNYTSGSFFPSGSRVGDAARTFLPFIGNHRASSIFLEPVSMGNFPIICLAWLLAVRPGTAGMRLAMYGATMLCIVLPDSRFAGIACVLIWAFAHSGFHKSALIAAVLPTCTLLILLLIGIFTLAPDEVPRLMVDDFSGRVLQSGKLLAYWTMSDWLALSPSPISVLDTGYAYLINATGLPIALLLAVCLAAVRAPTPESQAMRGLLVLYVALDLCIGQSVFSIKTAALLWYLYGASGISANPAARGRMRRAAAPHVERPFALASRPVSLQRGQ